MRLQVKLAYQESEVVALLKKIPLGVVEMSAIRDRAEQLRDGNLCDYRPVLPLMLASFIFDVLCTPGERRLVVCTLLTGTGLLLISPFKTCSAAFFLQPFHITCRF